MQPLAWKQWATQPLRQLAQWLAPQMRLPAQLAQQPTQLAQQAQQQAQQLTQQAQQLMQLAQLLMQQLPLTEVMRRGART